MLRCLIFLLPVVGLACQDQKPAPATTDRKVALADSSDSESGATVNPWNNAGCTLVTDEDVERLFGINGRDATLNTRSLPDQAFCLRTWNKPDWKERENNNDKGQAPYLDPQNRLIIEVIDYHTPVIAEAQFQVVQRERRDIYEENVPGIGEAAFWSTSTATLLIRKDRFALKISLEHLDTPHDNLAKAREVAQVALAKMQ